MPCKMLALISLCMSDECCVLVVWQWCVMERCWGEILSTHWSLSLCFPPTPPPPPLPLQCTAPAHMKSSPISLHFIYQLNNNHPLTHGCADTKSDISILLVFGWFKAHLLHHFCFPKEFSSWLKNRVYQLPHPPTLHITGTPLPSQIHSLSNLPS